MARRSRKNLKSQLVSLLTLAVAACLVITLGSLVPSLGLPGWADVLGLGKAAPTNTHVEGELEVHFIDVGNADCTLVRQGEHTLLIDAGERGDGDDILAYLREQGVTKLDLVVATHAHADHIGSMADVLKGLPVERFLLAYMPEEEPPTTATYLNMLEALNEKQIPADEAKPDAVYELGEARLQVLAPLQESKDTNDMSVVTRLTFGSRAFLFTGDAGTDVEKDMLQAGHTLQADVLKVGHHGSDTSSSEAFLRQVDPDYAFIPCGQGNSYGHPHKEILQRLDALGATIYRSDLHGHVVFTTDGSSLSVQTEE